jgi:hypothetical protein
MSRTRSVLKTAAGEISLSLMLIVDNLMMFDCWIRFFTEPTLEVLGLKKVSRGFYLSLIGWLTPLCPCLLFCFAFF